MSTSNSGDFLSHAKTKLQELKGILEDIDIKDSARLAPLRRQIEALQQKIREQSAPKNTPERLAIATKIKNLTELINEYEHPGSTTEPVPAKIHWRTRLKMEQESQKEPPK